MLIHCENDKCKHYFEDSCIKNTNNEMISLDNTGKCIAFEKGTNEAYTNTDKEKRYKLTKDEALAMLPNKEYIHTFRSNNIALVGADWTREEMLEMIEQYEFELTGKQATSMGHGMAFKDELGWIFVETI
jgi:hypothetical protein